MPHIEGYSVSRSSGTAAEYTRKPVPDLAGSAARIDAVPLRRHDVPTLPPVERHIFMSVL